METREYVRKFSFRVSFVIGTEAAVFLCLWSKRTLRVYRVKRFACLVFYIQANCAVRSCKHTPLPGSCYSPVSQAFVYTLFPTERSLMKTKTALRKISHLEKFVKLFLACAVDNYILSKIFLALQRKVHHSRNRNSLLGRTLWQPLHCSLFPSCPI